MQDWKSNKQMISVALVIFLFNFMVVGLRLCGLEAGGGYDSLMDKQGLHCMGREK